MTAKQSKLSEILQKLMRDKRLHAAELARRVNLQQPTVQRILAGTYQRPHVKTLQPLAEFFGITIDQLTGAEPITWLPSSKEVISRIPILNSTKAAQWPDIDDKSHLTKIVIDSAIGKNAYAMQMPDASMEPVFPKGCLLIIDPDKTPKDRSFVMIKLNNYQEIIFRQLLIDGKNRYIKPLSPDLEQFKMALLGDKDHIMGSLVQARLDYEK